MKLLALALLVASLLLIGCIQRQPEPVAATPSPTAIATAAPLEPIPFPTQVPTLSPEIAGAFNEPDGLDGAIADLDELEKK